MKLIELDELTRRVDRFWNGAAAGPFAADFIVRRVAAAISLPAPPGPARAAARANRLPSRAAARVLIAPLSPSFLYPKASTRLEDAVRYHAAEPGPAIAGRLSSSPERQTLSQGIANAANAAASPPGMRGH